MEELTDPEIVDLYRRLPDGEFSYADIARVARPGITGATSNQRGRHFADALDNAGLMLAESEEGRVTKYRKPLIGWWLNRAREWAELRKAGMSYQNIADQYTPPLTARCIRENLMRFWAQEAQE